jgi:hypothetical protein
VHVSTGKKVWHSPSHEEEKLATVLYKECDWEGAFAGFRIALALLPALATTSGGAKENLAHCRLRNFCASALMKLGRYEAASADYKEALQV